MTKSAALLSQQESLKHRVQPAILIEPTFEASDHSGLTSTSAVSGSTTYQHIPSKAGAHGTEVNSGSVRQQPDNTNERSSDDEMESQSVKYLLRSLGRLAIEKIRDKKTTLHEQLKNLKSGAQNIPDSFKPKLKNNDEKTLPGTAANYSNGLLNKYDNLSASTSKNGARLIYGVKDGKKTQLAADTVLQSYGYNIRKKEEAKDNTNTTNHLDKLSRQDPKLGSLLVKFQHKSTEGKLTNRVAHKVARKTASLINNKSSEEKKEVYDQLNAFIAKKSSLKDIDSRDRSIKNSSKKSFSQKADSFIFTMREKISITWLKAGLLIGNTKDRTPSRMQAIKNLDNKLFDSIESSDFSEKQKKMFKVIGSAAIGLMAFSIMYAGYKLKSQLGEGVDVGGDDDIDFGGGDTQESHSLGGSVTSDHELDTIVSKESDSRSLDGTVYSSGGAVEVGIEQHNHGDTTEHLESTPSGWGTSHYAKNEVGIDFASRSDWDQFNNQTNHLFSGLDDTYKMPNGQIGLTTNFSLNSVPQEIIEQMQKVAKDIKKN